MLPPTFVTPQELAAILKVPLSTIYQHASCGKLKGIKYKVGKQIRFPLEKALLAFYQGAPDNVSTNKYCYLKTKYKHKIHLEDPFT